MIVRATRDLATDTEITHMYYGPPTAGNDDDRQEKLRHWGFSCTCALCQDEKNTSKNVRSKRERLRANIQRHLQSPDRSRIAKIESTLAAIASTYRQPASEVPRLTLWDPLFAVAEVYMHYGEPIKAINSALGALGALGYIIDGGRMPRASASPLVVRNWGLLNDALIRCRVFLAVAYGLVAPDLATQAREYAKLCYRMCTGEDESFDETYSQFRRGQGE